MRARWWHALADGRLQCDLCPRHCRLRDGQRAFCFVRQRVGDEIQLTTYGRSTGFCIDPIEKKPLHHFLPGEPVLSFGTAGCNLGCRFCQNWHISKTLETDRLSVTAPPAAIARTALAHGCAAVAYTYNDPIPFAEYAIDTALTCRAAGLANIAVTNGWIADAARAEFFDPMDAANVDLKGFTERFYRTCCLTRPTGLRHVQDTLLWLRHDSDVWLEVTTLLIPGLNDSDREVRRLAVWIRDELGPDVPLHLTAFHPAFQLQDLPPTPLATVRRARAIALEQGLFYVYTGNLPDRDGQVTRCPSCATVVLARDGYTIRSFRITAQGRCPNCGAAISGVFRDQPGTWGARFLPVGIVDADRPTPRPAPAPHRAH